MANYLGALLGAAIDREDGDSGIEGAIMGTLAEGALKILFPLAVTFAIGAAVQYAVRKAIESVSGDDPVRR